MVDMTQVQKFLIGSGCFHYWFETLGTMRALDLGLREFLAAPHGLNGLELVVSKEDLARWANLLGNGIQTLPDPLGKLSPRLNAAVLGLSANTVHIPPLSSFAAEEIPALGAAITTIHNCAGISHFTVHPDETPLARWGKLISLIPASCKLSVENMDYRKRDYQTLAEMSALLDEHAELTCTFDICHWLELDRAGNDRELLAFLKRYKKRVTAIHLSVPSSDAGYYEDSRIETSHFMVNSSAWTIPHQFFDAISPDASIILEGVIPVGPLDVVKDELLVAQLLTRATQPRRRRARDG